MNICQVKQFFNDKKETPCQLTERLIKAGYQQTGGGYIDLAKKRGLTVDYTKAEPTQYWHLLEEYCPSVDKVKSFNKSIVCDCIFCVHKSVSKKIANRISCLFIYIVF